MLNLFIAIIVNSLQSVATNEGNEPPADAIEVLAQEVKALRESVERMANRER